MCALTGRYQYGRAGGQLFRGASNIIGLGVLRWVLNGEGANP